MKYTCKVFVIAGHLKGIGGTIEGSLNDKRSYRIQVGAIEKQLEEYAAWLTIPRSHLSPDLNEVVVLLDYWEDHRHEIKPVQVVELSNIIINKDSEQTELF